MSAAVRSIEYCIVQHDKGWMIDRQGQCFGPYSSKQDAVREAVYVANYSTNHGLQAEVIVQEAFSRLPNRLLAAFRVITHPATLH
jgi:hypothetical protein